MYRLNVEEADKINFIKDIYLEFEQSQTMIFVNRKIDGQNLTTNLLSQGTQAKLLMSGVD